MALIMFIVWGFSAMASCLCADINVALGKPAKQSSVAPDLTFATANKAVDGDDDNQRSMDQNSCIHTAYQGNPKTAWWQVDLLKPYQLNNVYIVYRDWINSGTAGVGRLAGFSIFVSNISSGWLHSPSKRCFHWTNSSLPNARALYPCNGFGRYITIYNERNGSEPSNYSANAVLQLCEVNISVPGNCHNCKGSCSGDKCVTCDIGYYGNNCERYCGRYCNDGISCNKDSGVCNDGLCRDDYYIKNGNCTPCINNRCIKCKIDSHCQVCYAPWKGQYCSTKCIGCGGDRSCIEDSGSIVCNNTCLDDTMCSNCPPSCDHSGCVYREGTASCTMCGNNTYDHDCKPCPNGCSKCQGPDAYCTHCLDGYYGFQCTMSCPVGCKNSTSDDVCTRRSDGSVTCKYGCKPLHYGSDCRPCGEKCTACSSTDGTCYRCKDGFYGPICNRACPSSCGGNKSCSGTGEKVTCNDGCDQHYYGEDCSKRCSVNCSQQICNATSGKCDRCISKTYGDKCTLSCGNCWNGEQCLQSNGYCNGGCTNGYYGDKCTEICPSTCGGVYHACEQLSGKCKECPLKMYGNYCTNQCSEHCAVDGACYINNGTCKHSCTQGYIGHDCNTRGCENPKMWGPTCNLTCPSTCKAEGHCDADTAMCLDGCAPGYFGSNCSSDCLPNCGGKEGDCERNTGQCLYGCREGWTDPKCSTENKANSALGAAVGGALAGCLVIALVIIFVVFRRRRISSKKREGRHESVSDDTAREQENQYRNIILTSKPTCAKREAAMPNEKPEIIEKNDKPALKPKPRKTARETYYNSDHNEYYNMNETMAGVPFDDFRTYVAKMIGDQKLNSEYENIPYGALHPTLKAEEEENKPKNRFKTTFPYDSTRVVLKKTELQKSDYINANFIDGLHEKKKYIATQGPLQNTIEDFWRMVWQYGIGKIVMLTGIVEGGKTKCEKYWPDPNEPVEHGGYRITLLDERIYSYYTLRELKIENKKAKQSRRLLHFHFTAWPDHDVTNPVLLVQFHQRVLLKKSTRQGPLLVHCSAGIGRTGTYIGLDELLEQGKKQGRIDVKAYVRKMRDCRMNMVQKPAQYQLLHEALVEAVQLPKSSIKMADYPAEWEKMQSDNRPVNQQRLKKEYETLKEMKRICSSEDCKSANAKENKHKNRPKSCLAMDEYRPYLMKYAKGRTDYINAVIVPSYTSTTGYYVTQRPLRETVVDFWRLVCDHETKIIIHFESDDEDKTTFYPTSNQLNVDEYTISTLKAQKVSDTLEEYEIVVFCKDEEEETTVDLIKVSTKNSHLPDSTTLIKAAELVNNKIIGREQSPVAVVSSDGSNSCDVFCAVMNIMERMKLDNEIDMFQTVRQLQMRRPEFFAEFENYRLAHEAVYKHLTSESVYFNQ